jgi:hypothetical protein
MDTIDTLTRDRYVVVRGLMRDIDKRERELDRLRDQRDGLIRELYLDGQSVRTIANEVGEGMGRSYVGQLVRNVERSPAA